MKVVYGIVCMVLAGLLLSARYENLETLSPSQAMLVLSCAVALFSTGFFFIVLGVASRKPKWRDQVAKGRAVEAEAPPVIEDESGKVDGDDLNEDDDSSDISGEQPVLASDDSAAVVEAQAETETAVVVESKLEKNRRESIEKARLIAAEKWSVSRVVVVFEGKSETWRALIMIRTLDGSSSRSLELLMSHSHYEEFFALDEREVVEFACDDENFETGDFSTTIPEDFLRIVMPLRSADKVKTAEKDVEIAGGGFI